MRVGEAVSLSDLEIGLARSSDDGERVRISVRDGTGQLPIAAVDLHRDHSVRIQRGSDLVVIDYVRRSWFGKAERRRAHIDVKVMPGARDADAERALQQAARITATRQADQHEH